MEWKNELTKTLKISYPVVQAPMLGVTTPQMVAAISNEGGLGSLPVGGLPPAKTLELIQQTKQLTHKPFAVNLFANCLPARNDVNTFNAMQSFLANFAADNKINYSSPTFGDITFHSYKEQVDILIQENIPIVSFTFGIPDDDSIQRLKNNGVVLIGTATCLEEAVLLDKKGIDVITAQGIEAGGHRGTFLEDVDLPMIGSMALIPGIGDAIKKPVIAAGAIVDGRSIKAALILGAQGVQLGSAFIACDESSATEAYKSHLQNAVDTDIVLTKSFTGRWARGVKNKLIGEIEKSHLKVPDYPFQISLTSSFREFGQKQNNKDYVAMWAGQSSAKTLPGSAAQIFRRLIDQTEKM